MPKFHVQIAQLCRQVADVIVEAPSEAELVDRLDEVYQQYDDSNWEDDWKWGVDEGTHTIVGRVEDGTEAEIVLDGDEEED